MRKSASARVIATQSVERQTDDAHLEAAQIGAAQIGVAQIADVQAGAAQIDKAMIAQTSAFKKDVLHGLSLTRKALPSRWLYDHRGSELFEQITTLEEYYPTRTETAILEANAESLADFCGTGAVIIEYGAGASVKSQILLHALHQPRLYVPIDIAGDFLAIAAANLRLKFPHLEILPFAADFTQDFDLPANVPKNAARTGFFPGSTIGNLGVKDAAAFLARVHRHVSAADLGEAHPGRAIIGIDLKKSTDILLPAYDDAEGVTAAFNLNLLDRINGELDGTFDLRQFRHEARWNESESAIEMHLVSTANQIVEVSGQTFEFADGETIHTESSRKYSIDGFSTIAKQAGWSVQQIWTDDEGLFAVVGLETAHI